MSLPPPPSRDKDLTGPAWQKWFSLVHAAIAPFITGGLQLWSSISKSGSNLNDLETRNHTDLQSLNTADYTHLSEVNHDLLTLGVVTSLHKHDHTLQENLNSVDYYHLTETNHTDLTDGGVTELHKHDFDFITFPVGNSIGTFTHVYTLSEYMNHQWSAGVVDGGLLTDNGDGTISIAAAVSTIRASTDQHGTLYGVVTPAQLNIALVDDATNYIYLNYAGVSTAFAATTTETTPNGLDKVLAWEVHRFGNLLHYIDQRDQSVDSIRKSAKLQADIIRFTHTAGGSILGANGLAITLTAGEFHRRFENLSHVAFDTSIAGTANANTFVLWNHVAGVYTSTEGSKLIDTTLWDNGTGTATIGANNFGVSWVYVVNDSPSELHVVMGQAEYAKLSDTAVASPPATLPTLLTTMASLVGFVAYEKSNTVFDDIYSAFSQTFTPGLATQHNSLGGLQGGTINEYYHLTAAEYAALGTGSATLAQARAITSLRM